METSRNCANVSMATSATMSSRTSAKWRFKKLRYLLESRRRQVRLVYATGRSFPSTWALTRGGVLPAPDAVAAFVGTEVWFPPWENPEPQYTREISERWNVGVIRRVMARFPHAVTQPARFQTLWKCSYYLSDQHQDILP